MRADIISLGLLGVLALGLLTAAWTDARSRKIYNWLTGPLALAAPLFWWASGYGLHDIGWQLVSALGWFVGLAAINAFGWLGGGDVKLLTALALWVRPLAFLNLLMVMALVGGGLCVAIFSWKMATRQRNRPVVPYGLAIAVAGWRFWRAGASVAEPAPRALETAVSDVLSLRYLGGGGHGCNDKDGGFSTARRHCHHALFYGFALCFAATSVATIYHHGFGWVAPYAALSLPVVLGTLGGIGMVVGAVGLIWLKIVGDSEPVARQLR